jgi:phospholipase D3/4
VESIPENLTYPSGSVLHPSTYSAWKELIQSANETIDIASFYWTLLPTDLNITDPSDWPVDCSLIIYHSCDIQV